MVEDARTLLVTYDDEYWAAESVFRAMTDDLLKGITDPVDHKSFTTVRAEFGERLQNWKWHAGRVLASRCQGAP